MKRNICALAAILVVSGGLSACNVESDSAAVDEPIGVDSEAIVTGAVGPLFWPTGPVTWDADGIGTWPIAVWSNQPLSWLALDVPGSTMLGVDLVGIDGALMGGFSSIAIDSARIDMLGAGSWMGGLWPSYGMLPWVNGLNPTSFYGAPAYVYGLGYSPFVSNVSTFSPMLGGLSFPGLLPAGLTTTGLSSAALLPTAGFLNPSITSSALLFDSFPLMGATSPLLLNVRFSGLDATRFSSLNLFSSFATSSSASSSIQATVFPIMGIPGLL